MTIFTICSNNYLAQAIVLGNSVKENNPNDNFSIFLCDKKSSQINYEEIPHEVIELETVEPNITELAKKYNIIELNTAVKPTVFEYLFKNGVEKAIYLDPDIFVFQPLDILNDELESYSILLTPHIFKPIPLDGKTPSESTFLNYGIYNLGFLALKNDNNTISLLKWWKNITYNIGFNNPAQGIFVDQLPMNFTPLFFNNVKILSDVGYNMAPWNLHERQLNKINDEYVVNNSTKLKFYHFSSFKFSNIELPIHFYNRYKLEERKDLYNIHLEYRNAVLASNHETFKSIVCIFDTIRKQVLDSEEQFRKKNMPLVKKIFTLFKHLIPESLKNKLR